MRFDRSFGSLFALGLGLLVSTLAKSLVAALLEDNRRRTEAGRKPAFIVDGERVTLVEFPPPSAVSAVPEEVRAPHVGARPMGAAQLGAEHGRIAGHVHPVLGEEELEVGVRGLQGAGDVGGQAELSEDGLGRRHVPWARDRHRAPGEGVAVIRVALAQVPVGEVEHPQAAAGEQRAGHDAAELGADDAHVVDALGRRRPEGLRHGGGVYARGAAAPIAESSRAGRARPRRDAAPVGPGISSPAAG